MVLSERPINEIGWMLLYYRGSGSFGFGAPTTVAEQFADRVRKPGRAPVRVPFRIEIRIVELPPTTVSKSLRRQNALNRVVERVPLNRDSAGIANELFDLCAGH